MARYQIPQAGAQGATPQQILADVGKPQCVVLQNVGATPLYVSENQNTLAQVDSNGTPTDGFILPPNSDPISIDRVVGALFGYSLGGAGLANCTGWVVC